MTCEQHPEHLGNIQRRGLPCTCKEPQESEWWKQYQVSAQTWDGCAQTVVPSHLILELLAQQESRTIEKAIEKITHLSYSIEWTTNQRRALIRAVEALKSLKP